MCGCPAAVGLPYGGLDVCERESCMRPRVLCQRATVSQHSLSLKANLTVRDPWSRLGRPESFLSQIMFRTCLSTPFRQLTCERLSLQPDHIAARQKAGAKRGCSVFLSAVCGRQCDLLDV
eukprot:363329-Chlamydomonas_euryale.AAC.5